MKYIISFFLAFVACSLKGNNVQLITGSVIDDESNALVNATIRCFVDDTTFVKGTTTNSNGDFKLEVPQTDKMQRLVFSYLGYKEQVVNIQPSEEASVRLGNIVMKKDITQIHEVIVLGENQVRTEEKLMVYPTKEELRHAYDGYSALDALMVPELSVSTFDHSIKYMNQTVLICINGREATQGEVRDLDSKYIKRVDLYPMGKPEFPQANTVIDFIMKVRDYAGTVGVNAEQKFTSLEGDGRVNAQIWNTQQICNHPITIEFKERIQGKGKIKIHQQNHIIQYAISVDDGKCKQRNEQNHLEIDSTKIDNATLSTREFPHVCYICIKYREIEIQA